MKHTAVIKSVLAVASLLAITCQGSFAASANYAQTEKELKIMSKIFETSLNEQSAKKTAIYGSKKAGAIYLAEQGMVFSFNFGRNSFISADDWGQFGEGIGQFVGAIASEVGNALSEAQIAPVAPVAPRGDYNFDFDYEDHFEAYQEQMEALESMREAQQEQREQVRELQREIRSLERQSERESGNDAELSKAKHDLEKKMEELNEKMNRYQESMREYREKRDQKYVESSKAKSEIVLSTLCDYGATLRSLKSDEHITLIFDHFNGDKAQIYVFKSNDVANCESPEKLLKKAISYQL